MHVELPGGRPFTDQVWEILVAKIALASSALAPHDFTIYGILWRLARILPVVREAPLGLDPHNLAAYLLARDCEAFLDIHADIQEIAAYLDEILQVMEEKVPASTCSPKPNQTLRGG